MEEDNLYGKEEGSGRLKKQAALGVVVFVCMVSVVSWSFYRWYSRGMMGKELRWSDPNNTMPWEEKRLLWQEDRLVQLLLSDVKVGSVGPETFEGQPEIIEGLIYEAKLHRGGEQYGEIKLGVRLDGTVAGEWSGEFKRGEPEKRYRSLMDKQRRYVSNSFRGNIVKTKIYSDEEGQDRSRLYFIARGELLLEKFDYQMRESRGIRGDVYVTGWMGSDYDVEGKLYLCWTDLVERVKKTWSARGRGEESQESSILTPETVEVFEWEGAKIADSE
jgi:hypothetical protein